MQTVEKWRWRIRWAGRWTSTRIHQTEAEIRAEHPEAVRIEESRIVVQQAASQDEVGAAHRGPRRYLDAGGRALKMWEPGGS